VSRPASAAPWAGWAIGTAAIRALMRDRFRPEPTAEKANCRASLADTVCLPQSRHGAAMTKYRMVFKSGLLWQSLPAPPGEESAACRATYYPDGWPGGASYCGGETPYGLPSSPMLVGATLFGQSSVFA
jgi:hypothetical protein